jgi:hypothetical protein
MVVDIMEHVSVLISMVRTMAENVMAAEVSGLAIADRVFEAIRTLLGCL